jgi:hypothetical protein
MEDKRKRVLFIAFLTILLLPFIQKSLAIIDSGGLYGDYTVAPDMAFSWDKWWDGAYQHAKNEYLNDNGGFRVDMVHINNQVDYWLFKKLHSNSVVLGKNKVLYQADYITSKQGKDFIGHDSALYIMLKLKAIQDTMTRSGKTLILAFAPCKAFYYPNDYPANLDGPQLAPSNYTAFTHLADSLHINKIDFNAWLLAMKDTSKELLYSRQGIHWTVYGSLLAEDSLTRCIEGLRGIQMPHITWTNATHTSKARDTDDDINKALNLIIPVTTELFTYPDLIFNDDTTRKKPKVIYIGDSFIFTWVHNNYMNYTNADWEYYYYFRQVVNQGNKDTGGWLPIENYDWQSKLKTMDCIVIMYTSHNLHALGNGFIEQAFNYYYPAKK